MINRNVATIIGYAYSMDDVLPASTEATGVNVEDDEFDTQEMANELAQELKCNVDYSGDNDDETVVFYLPRQTSLSLDIDQCEILDSMSLPNQTHLKQLEKLGERIRLFFKGTKLSKKVKPAIHLVGSYWS